MGSKWEVQVPVIISQISIKCIFLFRYTRKQSIEHLYIFAPIYRGNSTARLHIYIYREIKKQIYIYTYNKKRLYPTLFGRPLVHRRSGSLQ